MSLLQRRQPKGTPTGGQFATTGRTEPGTTLTAPAPTWLPDLEFGVDQALGTLHANVAPADERFPGSQHAAAVDALHELADALLERRGVPRTYARGNDELVDLRTAVAEQVTSQEWTDHKRDLVMSALGDINLARKADHLARMTPGKYEIHVVHYLASLERARRDREAAL